MLPIFKMLRVGYLVTAGILIISYPTLGHTTGMDYFTKFDSVKVSGEILTCPKGVVHTNEYGDMKGASWFAHIVCRHNKNLNNADWIIFYGQDEELPEKFRALTQAHFDNKFFSDTLSFSPLLYNRKAIFAKNCKTKYGEMDVEWKCKTEKKIPTAALVKFNGRVFGDLIDVK